MESARSELSEVMCSALTACITDRRSASHPDAIQIKNAVGGLSYAPRKHRRQVASHIGPRVSKLAAVMDEAEADVIANMRFPAWHRAKILSTNPLERVNGEIKRRSEAVGIFRNEAAVNRPIGVLLLEQNDEWAVRRARHMILETIASLSDDRNIKLPIAW